MNVHLALHLRNTPGCGDISARRRGFPWPAVTDTAGLPSRAAQAAREWRLGLSCPLPPYLGPGRYLIRIRSGVTAQLRGLPRMRFVQLPLGEALQDPGYLGQQVRPPGRELAQLGHRGHMLGLGELPPPRVMLCRTRELGDKDTISLRTLIDHAFYCYTGLACFPARRPEAGQRPAGTQ